MIVLACCVTICSVSCASNVPESIAFADESTSIERPETADLTDEQRVLITFHATWLCELQRRTFQSLEDADAARSEALGITSIAEADYEDFVRVTLRAQLVRDAVLFEYQQLCRAE